jgi:hypothetical protein
MRFCIDGLGIAPAAFKPAGEIRNPEISLGRELA